MSTITANARSLSMLVRLNVDSLLWAATITAALAGAAWMAALLAAAQPVAPTWF